MNFKAKGKILGICLLSLVATGTAQQNASQSGTTEAQAASKAPDSSLPRVSMVFDHPEVAPNHFEIVVDSTGNASYISHSESKPDSLDATSLSNRDFERTFTLSSSTRDRIFQLAKAARYFNGDFDFTKSRIAFTGKKTLSYQDSMQAHSTTFNWSENPAIHSQKGSYPPADFTTPKDS